MIVLKKTYRKYNGEYEYVQKYKDEKIVIYQVNNNWFEVFKYRIHKPDKYHIDFYEKYPSDEDFGTWAWNICNKDYIVETMLKDNKKILNKCHLTEDELQSIMKNIV